MPRRLPALDAATIKDYVLVTNGCWLWTGKRNSEGYGRYGIKFAHRMSYEIFKGPIPGDLQVDHLCFNPSCIRPEHLQLLESAVNRRRQLKALAEECQRGHPFTPENTGFHKHSGRVQRYCKKCANASYNRRYQEHRGTARKAA